MTKWINVKDRLPARNHTVLGVVKMLPDGARTINKVRLTQAGNWIFFEDGLKVRHLESVVTHWAELPELPEEDEDENAD